MIIAFIVDTSASMYQRAYMDGPTLTYCDIARQTIERFLVERRKQPVSQGDRYMLMTFETPPNNVKIGWTEPMNAFSEALKHLQFGTLDTPADAIKNALDFLNLHRLRSGVDTFGHGRCPFKLEPTVLVILSDGAWSYGTDSIDPIQTSTEHCVKERYRWDQRIFYVGLRIPGAAMEMQPGCGMIDIPHDDSMENTCRLTGGRSYRITSASMLRSCIKHLSNNVRPGVVIDIGPLTVVSNITECQEGVACKQETLFFYVSNRRSFWPIPESYRPDLSCKQLPPRDAHPKVMVASEPSDPPLILKGFPIDWYQLSNCTLASVILMKAKKKVRQIWPIFLNTGVENEKSFGYLRSNHNLTGVWLGVLPYNYPELLPLLRDLIYTHCFKPPPEWLNQFNSYLDTVPKYYYSYLRRVFGTAMKMPQELVQHIIPKHLDRFISPSVRSHLKLIKTRAKTEQCQFVRHLFNDQCKRHRQNQLTTCGVLHTSPSVNSEFTQKNLHLVPRRDFIDVIGKCRDRFVHPHKPAASVANGQFEKKFAENGTFAPKQKQSIIKNSAYDLRMRNQLKRNPGPISKDFVFIRPTNERVGSTASEEIALSDNIFGETVSFSEQEGTSSEE